MTRMHNPAHPGEVLKDGVFSDNNLSITAAAQALQVNRITLSRVLKGKARINAEMAIKLAKWLGTSPYLWAEMQIQYDLWQAERTLKDKIKKITPLKKAA